MTGLGRADFKEYGIGEKDALIMFSKLHLFCVFALKQPILKATNKVY